MDYNAAPQSPTSSFSELDHHSISSSWLSCGKASNTNTISLDGEDDEIVWSLSSSQSSVGPHRQTEERETSVTFESLVDFAAQGIPPPDGDDFVLIGSRSSGRMGRSQQQVAESDRINAITKALTSVLLSDQDTKPAAPRIIWSEECEESLTQPQSTRAESAKS